MASKIPIDTMLAIMGIKDLRKGRRLSQERLADDIGISVSYLSRLETGERNLSGKMVNKFSKYFGVPPGELFTPDSDAPIATRPIQSVTVVGTVEAGSWREALEWDESSRYPIAVPMLRSTAKSVFGLEVRGASMNREYRAGDVLICVPILEFHDELTNGKHVICQRVCVDGQVEATVKEFQRDEQGNVWLWPRSTDPQHQQPIRLDHPSSGADKKIESAEIIAVVVGSFTHR